jgi:site-specific DNA recombinase
VPPLGYINIGEPKKRIQVPDPDVAPLIRLMFELYDTGNYSTKSLADEMQARGLRTRKDKPVGKTHVWELLTNSYFIGIINWDGKQYPGKHELIIDLGLFQNVQNRLTRGTAPKYSKHNPLFKAMIECDECGGSVTWERQKGIWYGHCTGYKSCSKKKYVREDSAEKQAIVFFEALKCPHPELVEWAKKELKASHQTESEVHNASVEQLNRRYKKLDDMVDQLYDDKLEGRITADKHDSKLKEVKLERDAVLVQLKKLDEAKISYIQDGLDILDLSQKAADIYKAKQTTDEQRAMLRDIFSNLRLDGQTLLGDYKREIYYVFDKVVRTNQLEQTFEHDDYGSIKEKTAFNVAARSIWRARPDSNRRSSP